MKKSAFTLIKLLVVVSIIAVLAGLLMPAYQSAKSKSGSAQCVASLRQLHVATLLYANDNEGQLGTYPNNALWFSVLGPYLGINSTLGHVVERGPSFPVCRTALSHALSNATTIYDPRRNNNGFIRTYAINERILSKAPEFSSRMINIPYPSQTSLYMDGPPVGFSPPYYDRVTLYSWMRGTPSQFLKGQFVHNGAVNVVFLDGHVEAVDYSKIPADINNSRFWHPLGTLAYP
jgi:prepilin-type processing-associated H-X9-DG protein